MYNFLIIFLVFDRCQNFITIIIKYRNIVCQHAQRIFPYGKPFGCICMSIEKESKWYTYFLGFERSRWGRDAQFVVIIRLHGTGRVEDIRNGFPYPLPYAEACDAPRRAVARYVIPVKLSTQILLYSIHSNAATGRGVQ